MAEEQYHNISFKDFIAKRKGTLYYYNIDTEGDVSLNIYTSSLSELDDDDYDSGFMESFSYFEKSEAHDDMQTAKDITGIDFQEL